MVATEVKNAGGAASVATCDVEDWWRVTWLVQSPNISGTPWKFNTAPETGSSYLQMVGAHFGWFRDVFDKKGGGGQEFCWMIKQAKNISNVKVRMKHSAFLENACK